MVDCCTFLPSFSFLEYVCVCLYYLHSTSSKVSGAIKGSVFGQVSHWLSLCGDPLYSKGGVVFTGDVCVVPNPERRELKSFTFRVSLLEMKIVTSLSSNMCVKSG